MDNFSRLKQASQNGEIKEDIEIFGNHLMQKYECLVDSMNLVLCDDSGIVVCSLRKEVEE